MRLAALALGLVLALFSTSAALADAPVHPDPASQLVKLVPGQRLELTLDSANGLQVIASGPAADVQSQRFAPMNPYVEAVGATPIVGKPEPGKIVVNFWSTPGSGTKLRIDNGYDYPIVYRAYLLVSVDGAKAGVRTSVCPVLAGKTSVESWPKAVEGIGLAGFTAASPGHLDCDAGSALSVTAQPASGPTYVCTAGQTTAPIAPLTVSAAVDGSGAVRTVWASWAPSTDFRRGPEVVFNYPMEGDRAVPRPDGLKVGAMVLLQPRPTAKTASIILLLDGVEKARRPWAMYAQTLANTSAAQAAAGNKTVGFFGIIPFFLEPFVDNGGLGDLLAAVGQPGHTLAVRIEGDDGSVLGQASFDVSQPPVHSKATMDPLVSEALAKAKSPTSCQKQGG